MNRRHFFALTLPALIGTAQARVLADKVAEATPRQVNVKVDIIRARPEDFDAFTKAHPGFHFRTSRLEVPYLLIWLSVAQTSSLRTITLTTNEDVPTRVSITEPQSAQTPAASAATGTVFQPFSTSVSVTPHVNVSGTITLQLSVEDSQYSLAPDHEAPRHIFTQSADITHTTETGAMFCSGPSQPSADGRELLLFVTPTVLPTKPSTA